MTTRIWNQVGCNTFHSSARGLMLRYWHLLFGACWYPPYWCCQAIGPLGFYSQLNEDGKPEQSLPDIRNRRWWIDLIFKALRSRYRCWDNAIWVWTEFKRSQKCRYYCGKGLPEYRDRTVAWILWNQFSWLRSYQLPSVWIGWSQPADADISIAVLMYYRWANWIYLTFAYQSTDRFPLIFDWTLYVQLLIMQSLCTCSKWFNFPDYSSLQSDLLFRSWSFALIH